MKVINHADRLVKTFEFDRLAKGKQRMDVGVNGAKLNRIVAALSYQGLVMKRLISQRSHGS